MKIRQGFISNSSSSSFVAFMKKETWLTAMKDTEDPSHKDLIKYASENFTFEGEAWVRIDHMDTESGGTVWDYISDTYCDEDKEVDYRETEKLNQILNAFVARLPKNKLLTYEDYK